MFRIFWQVWLGETGKKMPKMLKKKEIVNNRIFDEFWI